jgi:hypothetical protein
MISENTPDAFIYEDIGDCDESEDSDFGDGEDRFSSDMGEPEDMDEE